MSIEISYINKIEDIDDYIPGGLITIVKPGIEHTIRFYHRKEDPPCGDKILLCVQCPV